MLLSGGLSGGEEHGHVLSQRRVGSHERGDVLLVQLVGQRQIGDGIQVVADEGRGGGSQNTDDAAVVFLLVQGESQTAGTLAVGHAGDHGVHVVHAGTALQVVVTGGLGNGQGRALIADGRDALGDFVQKLNGEQGLAGVAEDDFLEHVAFHAVDDLGLAHERQQLLVGKLVQEPGQAGDGSGRGNLLHVLVVAQDFIQRRLALIIVVLLTGGHSVDGLSEDGFGVVFQNLLDKRIEGGIQAQERGDVGHDRVQNETADAGFVQRRDIALVVAGRDDLQIVGQLGTADGPQGRDGQALGCDIRGGSVQLVHKENGRLSGMGLGIFDGFVDDLMGIKHLRICRVPVVVGMGHQTGAG